MSSPVGVLKPELLYLILFGPGYGESMVVRVPPNHWVVIDSLMLSGSGEVPALELLRDRGAQWSGVVLSHPHRDHALGLDTVLNHRGGGFVGCAEPYVVQASEQWRLHPDAERQQRLGSVEATLAAIQDRWERFPGERWEMFANDGENTRIVGEARFQSLHPRREEQVSRQLGVPRGYNDRATPLLVEWHAVRLLLGSDLGREGWESVARRGYEPPLAVHTAFKVAHHGSVGALHDCQGGDGSRNRLWALTPYNRGRKLPRFEDGQGVERLLGYVDELHLTALPFKVPPALQEKRPVTRQEVLDASSKRDPLEPEPLPLAESGPGAWAAFGFAADGTLADVQHGPSAMRVREQPQPRILVQPPE